MNNEQKSVLRWMQRAGQACPEVPTMPEWEVRKLRAKLLLEEVLETIIDGLGIEVFFEGGGYLTPDAVKDEEYVYFDDKGVTDLVATADGISDLQVVNLGTAVACGIDIEPCFDEVMRSNNSKWWTAKCLCFVKSGHASKHLGDGLYCVTDEGGKIQKSPGFSKPNLLPILTTQSQKKAEK